MLSHKFKKVIYLSTMFKYFVHHIYFSRKDDPISSKIEQPKPLFDCTMAKWCSPFTSSLPTK